MKVVFISGMLPVGHYSQSITSGLANNPGIELIVYADKDPKNLEIQGCGEIKLVWSKSLSYVYEILRQVLADKPDLIHLQHELNMYGGLITAMFFPLLLLMLKIMGFKTVVTVHAAVYKKQIDHELIRIFHQNPKYVKPFMVSLAFHYIYKSISLLSGRQIVHTELTRKIISTDYGVDAKRVKVIPIAIPQKRLRNLPKEHYFFYFGYMARRKGLGYLLDGFQKYLTANPHSDFRLILAGGIIKGQEEAFDEIKNQIEGTAMKGKVEMKGFINMEQQDDLYEKAYAVCNPAILSMGSSGPLFHAASYGKCVIATKIGHFIEDLDHLKTGYLIENDKWHDAFKYIAENPEVVKQIEQATLKKAKERSPENTARIYLEWYREAIGK